MGLATRGKHLVRLYFGQEDVLRGDCNLQNQNVGSNSRGLLPI